jgi:HlyD family secretion protein
MTTSPDPSGQNGPNDKDLLPVSRARAIVNWLRPAARAELTEEEGEVTAFYSPAAAMMVTPPRRAASQLGSVIGVGMMICIIIIVTVPLDRVATGSGKVLSLTPELVVQPVNPAVVKTIAVSTGDIVRKGQLLAQLDPTLSASDTQAAKDALDRYSTEVDRLGAELHQQNYRPKVLSAGALVQENIFAQRAAAREAQLRYYQGQIDAQKALIAQATADVVQYAKETGLAVDVEKIRLELNQEQVGSRLDLAQATSQRIEAERQVLTSIQQRENATQQVAALQGQLDSYNQQWFADVSQSLTDDSVQVANYQDQLEHAALALKLIDLRADQDSIVLSVAPVSIGSVLQAGQTFFTLVPLNAPMEVDAQITADEAGFVFPGMPAEIKFTSFPSTIFGTGFGTVRLISPDSFLTGAGSAGSTSSGLASNMIFTGQSPNSPYFYDVRVTLDRLALLHMPSDFHLIPGMAVEADVKVGEQTFWQYMMVRIIPTFTEGFHEPT